MRLEHVQELLQLISELDRSPFPDGAAVSWQEILLGVSYSDAEAVVREWYGSSLARDKQGQMRRILPADVRSGANRRAEERARAARRVLEGPPLPPLADRGAAVQAEVAKARERLAEAIAKHRATTVGAAA